MLTVLIGKTVLLIKSYLENRWHRNKINTSFSTWEELLHGVPQGSVLGPLLFNIYFKTYFSFLIIRELLITQMVQICMHVILINKILYISLKLTFLLNGLSPIA